MTVLLVVLLIAFFLGLDWLRQRRARAVAVPAGSGALRLQRGVFFARSHTWLSLFPSGRAWLGVDDFVARMLERPTVRPLTAPGSRVRRGEPLFELEEGGRTLTVKSPVDARLVAFHDDLLARGLPSAELPSFHGWIAELEPEQVPDLKSLLLGDESVRWMSEELRRLRDVLAGSGPEWSPVALQDGGPPVSGALTASDADTWRRFEQEFLEVR